MAPRRGGGQQIAGHLFDREPIERQVGVDRVDHPVAHTATRRGADCLFHNRPNRHNGPCPASAGPMLAEVRRIEQPIDQSFIRLACGIVHERIDRVRLGRKAEQVVRQPLDERVAVRFRVRLQAVFVELGQHERIDLRCAARPRSSPAAAPWLCDRMKGPMTGGPFALGPRAALIHPAADGLNLRRKGAWTWGPAAASARRHRSKLRGARSRWPCSGPPRAADPETPPSCPPPRARRAASSTPACPARGTGSSARQRSAGSALGNRWGPHRPRRSPRPAPGGMPPRCRWSGCIACRTSLAKVCPRPAPLTLLLTGQTTHQRQLIG